MELTFHSGLYVDPFLIIFTSVFVSISSCEHSWLSVLRSKLISKQIMYIINFSELLRTLAVGLQTSYGTTELSQVGWEGNWEILLVLDFCCLW